MRTYGANAVVWYCFSIPAMALQQEQMIREDHDSLQKELDDERGPQLLGAKEKARERAEELARVLGLVDGPCNPYEILGLKVSASKEEARREYRRLAHLLHPDKGARRGATEAIKAINNAWDAVNGGGPQASSFYPWPRWGDSGPDESYFANHFANMRSYWAQQSFHREENASWAPPNDCQTPNVDIDFDDWDIEAWAREAARGL